MLAAIQIQTIVGTIITLLYSVTVLGLVLVVITENRNPLKTLSWVIVLILAPGIGLLFYFFFGQDNRKQRVISMRTYRRIRKGPQRRKLPLDARCHVPPSYEPLFNLLYQTNQATLLYGTDIRVYTNGKNKFNDLLKDIRKAKHHIHIQYYIINDDEIGNQVKNALITKARAGVHVRMLYDDVGSWAVKKYFFREMRDAGIEVYPFLRVAFPVFTSKVNYRNHRKIVVIDGQIGYMGGMNIADRYINGLSWGTWRDTHFRFDGKGAHGLQSAFLVDWYVVSRQVISGKDYYPAIESHSDNLLQVAISGPTGPWRTLLQASIFLIANAKKYVYIQTPYFLPTEGLNQALQIAALGGVDVQLMLPKRSDTRSTNMASRSFLDEMIKAGVKVFFYTPGFLHSKLLVVDDTVAAIGSANMDFRSFEHNFEVNAYVYQKQFATKMRRMFMHDIRQCEQAIPSRWLRRPLKDRIMESFMRLFSPLL